MATATTPPKTTEPQPLDDLSTTSKRWPLGFLALAILVFVAYQWVIPHLSGAGQTFFQDWLP
jgi:hypothetical protein